ncbi:MAG: YHS domain-containing protein [Thermoanaerobaculia bacterium]
MAKDPVCGMTVAENSSLRSEHGGKTYLFCSAGCKAKFDQTPGAYTNSDKTGA